MRIVKQITNNSFLNLKEVRDDNMGCRGYQFAERKGVDSVAFVCYDESTGEYIINKEATPPTGEFLNRAFGGSIDKKISYDEIVKAEVLEEVGYKVPMTRIKLVGRSFVSTQMNQYCYLYLVKVSEGQKTKRCPENATEALSKPIRLTEDQIVGGDDWKSISIIAKARKLGII